MAIEYRSLQPSTITSNALQLKKNPVAVCRNCQVGLADAELQGAENVCMFSTVSTHYLSYPWSHIHSLCSHNTCKFFVGGKKLKRQLRKILLFYLSSRGHYTQGSVKCVITEL